LPQQDSRSVTLFTYLSTNQASSRSVVVIFSSMTCIIGAQVYVLLLITFFFFSSDIESINSSSWSCYCMRAAGLWRRRNEMTQCTRRRLESRTSRRNDHHLRDRDRNIADDERHHLIILSRLNQVRPTPDQVLFEPILRNIIILHINTHHRKIKT